MNFGKRGAFLTSFLVSFLFTVSGVSSVAHAQQKQRSGENSFSVARVESTATERIINGEDLNLSYGSHITYVSPIPGSKYLTPQTGIIVRSDVDLEPSQVTNNLFEVSGSISGVHYGQVILVGDQRIILFKPLTPFSLGETVSVSMSHPLQATNGDTVSLTPFSFTIAGYDLNTDRAFLSTLSSNLPEANVPTEPQSESEEVDNMLHKTELKYELEGLPANFPPLTVTKSDSPSSGYIFLSTNMIPNSKYGDYLIIEDNEGDPVFYRNVGSQRPWDFNIQANGTLTYFYGFSPGGIHYVMNTSLQITDSIHCQDGYLDDGHELRILPNGNIFLLGDDYEYVDMSSIVSGGSPDAKVAGDVIEELDKNKNVIFLWRSFDHFKITDCIGQNLDSTSIDAVHANAIAVDSDSSILLSSRHLSEITKISTQTGDIIWRLGGKNNQFTFVNDTVGFSYQHDVRSLPNGDITLMDNGNMHKPPFSRAAEYKLDVANKTATLVWQFRHDPDSYNPFMGNVQRLSDGNTMIGWGGAPTPTLTEVRPDGATALEMAFPYDSVYCYRVYRYPFLLYTYPSGGDTVKGGAATMIKWKESGMKAIDVDYSTDAGVSWSALSSGYPADADSINFTVPSDSSTSVIFRITGTVTTADSGLAFNSDTLWVSNQPSGIIHTMSPYSYFLFNNYPNPFNPTTTITYEIAVVGHVDLKVYDVLGQRVATLVNEVQTPGRYSVKFDGSRFASGVYFFRLTTSNGFQQVRKMLLEK